MPKKPNNKQKILYLRKIFEEQTDPEHGLTLAEIIAELEKFGISAERKSLYDDIETLKDFGIDIESFKDRQTRYYLGERRFEAVELKLLVDAVQSSKFITAKKSGELIKKIESLTSIHEAKLLHRQVFVTNRLKTGNESIYYIVDCIHTAIAENSTIRFKYFDLTIEKTRRLRRGGGFYEVSPFALTWDDENYYLIGYDASSDLIKHYRVDKMLEVSATGLPRQGEERFANFDIASYSKQIFGMFAGVSKNVLLECENELAGVIFDRFGTDITITKRTETSFNFIAKVIISPIFFAWVMSFGGRVKILSPDSVITELKTYAENVLSTYK